ncbi:metallophosphoesterase family protein [Halorubrum depositum]|uniref:metallophosphoesterase family protein n=1 Tax=Halorubrum depositum TaxID=2583992 RepID=UPI0011A78CD7|nr:metallophosphoesterase family protein [Halorubrum depositum]
MRIGLVSDVHSNSPALESVFEELERLGVDRTLCAGDLLGYNAFPNKTLNQLIENNVTAIRGNHDEAIVTETPSNFNIPAKRAVDWTRRQLSDEEKQYLKDLPNKRRMSIDGKDVVVAHGSPTNPVNQYVFEEDVTPSALDHWFSSKPDIVVLGHIHRQFTKSINDVKVVNPGSVGQPRDGDSRSGFAVWNTEEGSIDLHRTEYNIDKAARRTRAVLPRELGDRLSEGL